MEIIPNEFNTSNLSLHNFQIFSTFHSFIAEIYAIIKIYIISSVQADIQYFSLHPTIEMATGIKKIYAQTLLKVAQVQQTMDANLSAHIMALNTIPKYAINNAENNINTQHYADFINFVKIMLNYLLSIKHDYIAALTNPVLIEYCQTFDNFSTVLKL